MVKMSERLILCGGACGRRKTVPQDAVRLYTFGKDENVHLRSGNITRKMVANLPSLFADLLEIAAYVYAADQVVTRGGPCASGAGRDWRRGLQFAIPVRNVDLWSSPGVREPLTETLRFLSEDDYCFEFEPLVNPPQLDQYFDFPAEDGVGAESDEVMLFSGGLDSLAGAVQEVVNEQKRVTLVSHRSAPKTDPIQRDLAVALANHCGPDLRPFHVSVWVNKESALSHENTQRARSFLYASLAACVAGIYGLSRIRFYENGVTSLNLPIAEQVVGARATRSTHPRFLKGFAGLVSALTQSAFVVENPFIWKTKTDVVKLIEEAGCADLIGATVSCGHTIQRTKKQPHCGECSQCIDRRFGVLAAGCQRHDLGGRYRVDLLTGERTSDDSETMLESYIRTATWVSTASDDEFFGRFGEASRVLRHMNGSPDQVADRILDLYRRHSQQVCGVLKTALKDHAEDVLIGRLPASCAVILSLPHGRGIRHEQEPLTATTGDRPLRLWPHSHCPTCGRGGVEFLSFSEFSRRCKDECGMRLNRDTVSSRVRRGQYWADATSKVPWCRKCRHKAPEGEGVPQPVGEPHVDDYEPTQDDAANAMDWAGNVVRKRFPGFDPHMTDSPDPDAYEQYSVAVEAILQQIKARGGGLSPKQGKQIARDAIQAHLTTDYESREIHSRGNLAGSNRPADE